MTVLVKKRALNTLIKVSAFVESKNILGSGDRGFDKVMLAIENVANTKALLAICKNESLAKFSYRCFTFNDWVIAHKIVKNRFIVYRVIYGARLK